MKTQRRIAWEHWTHPLGGGKEWEDVDVLNHEESEGEEYFFEEEEMDETPIRPVVVTPMGIVPVKPYVNFSANFNFWMMHTNFSVSEEVANLIEHTPGVEIMDVLTRYRVRVGMGKCFNFREVRTAIERRLLAPLPEPTEENPYEHELDDDLVQQVAVGRKLLSDKFTYWAIFVFPNKSLDMAGFHTDQHEAYEFQYDLFRQAMDLAGGVLFVSHGQPQIREGTGSNIQPEDHSEGISPLSGDAES